MDYGREEFVGLVVELVGRQYLDLYASHTRPMLLPSLRVPMPFSEVILANRGILLLGDVLSSLFRPRSDRGWLFIMRLCGEVSVL